jgi:hypothetical protein
VAYFRWVLKDGIQYGYIVRSVRQDGQPRQEILEYLGREPSRDEISKAKQRWKVGPPPKSGRRARKRRVG